MKELKIHTATNTFNIKPGSGFSFMPFIHTIQSLGGFTDGSAIWIPTSAIQAVTYTEEDAPPTELGTMQ